MRIGGYAYDDMLERQREALEDAPETLFIGRKHYTARKRHSCQDCGSGILPGEKYVREAWRVDGEMVSVARHSTDGGCLAYLEESQ